MDRPFLDKAILVLASRERAKSRVVGNSETGVIVAGEDTDTWARRVVDDALALAARREIVLREFEAGVLVAEQAREQSRFAGDAPANAGDGAAPPSESQHSAPIDPWQEFIDRSQRAQEERECGA